jgi:hypothetical protein
VVAGNLRTDVGGPCVFRPLIFFVYCTKREIPFAVSEETRQPRAQRHDVHIGTDDSVNLFLSRLRRQVHARTTMDQARSWCTTAKKKSRLYGVLLHPAMIEISFGSRRVCSSALPKD